jgi:hypothetical protein
LNDQFDPIVERVLREGLNGERRPFHGGAQFIPPVGNHRDGWPKFVGSLWMRSPNGLSMQVGSTTMRLQPKRVRVVARHRPISVGDAAEHLVHLLVVLMGPHVRPAMGGQRVVGQQLETISKSSFAKNPNQLPKAEHKFNYGAQLDPVLWFQAHKPFVAGKHSLCHPVVAVQVCERITDDVELPRRRTAERPHRGSLRAIATFTT